MDGRDHDLAEAIVAAVGGVEVSCAVAGDALRAGEAGRSARAVLTPGQAGLAGARSNGPYQVRLASAAQISERRLDFLRPPRRHMPKSRFDLAPRHHRETTGLGTLDSDSEGVLPATPPDRFCGRRARGAD